ncbi:hypothetical protein [Cerasicoccus maritimus]|uniref:hypothetical protein n=1 Tax=Cerasicoccus maritimus TaxID=490089 RepID=UPI002852B9AB|nr:hypothetical protein [Cerasicoccus maritimus]
MSKSEDVSFGEWVVVHILLAIPLLNIVMLLYWSFAYNTKTSLQNYARSFIIFYAPLTIIILGLLATMAIPAYHKVRQQSREQALVNTQRVMNADDTQSEYRIFTANDGRTMEAKIIDIDGDRITIERIDGQVFTTSISIYTEADIDYINRLRGAMFSE